MIVVRIEFSDPRKLFDSAPGAEIVLGAMGGRYQIHEQVQIKGFEHMHFITERVMMWHNLWE